MHKDNKAMAISHPKIAMEPILAKLAGNNAIPLPIIFPATTAIQVNNPIFFAEVILHL